MNDFQPLQYLAVIPSYQSIGFALNGIDNRFYQQSRVPPNIEECKR
jgi:hypothetical protein